MWMYTSECFVLVCAPRAAAPPARPRTAAAAAAATASRASDRPKSHRERRAAAASRCGGAAVTHRVLRRPRDEGRAPSLGGRALAAGSHHRRHARRCNARSLRGFRLAEARREDGSGSRVHGASRRQISALPSSATAAGVRKVRAPLLANLHPHPPVGPFLPVGMKGRGCRVERSLCHI
eukprot:357079-Chlamydomonas_euryale.AAC.6